MKPPPDPTQMAQEFLKLWQNNITKTMNDPATIRTMLEAMQFMTNPTAETAHDARTRRPAPASAADDDALGDIRARLGRLEQSVARLVAAQNAAGTRRGRDDERVAANKRPAKPAAKRVAAKPAAKPKSKNIITKRKR